MADDQRRWVQLSDSLIAVPVQAPPSWVSANFYMLADDGLSSKRPLPAVADVRTARFAARALKANGVEVDARWLMTECILTGIVPSLFTPSGWVEPWQIWIASLRLSSLNLPSQLISAPGLGQAPLRLESESVAQHNREEVERRQRMRDAPMCDETLEFFMAYGRHNFRITWFDDSRCVSQTDASAGSDLVDQLRSPPAGSTGHLIEGCFVEHGLPLWLA